MTLDGCEPGLELLDELKLLVRSAWRLSLTRLRPRPVEAGIGQQVP